MPLLRRCFLALLILVAAPAQAAGDTDWFYRGTDIQRDPAWTFGTLPNGLRYAVRRNALPQGQVSIRLRIDVGSLHEEDKERGWAHYVEHMAFRGTKNFADGIARQTWQRLGASFGSDTNATTEPTQTVYQLDLPKNDEASLELSLKLLAEMADVANFDSAIVDAERGVVISERTRRPEASVRVGDAMRPLFYAGLKIAERDTIGTEETLKGATAAGLKAFYERWYRPERATLVLVGDADPKLLEALAARTFGGWKGTGPAPKEPDYGSPADVAERAKTVTYPGVPDYASLSWIRPYEAIPHTRARERGDLARAIARRIVNRRLEARARGQAAYLSASVSGERSVNIADYTTVSVMAKKGRWKEAVSEAYSILSDALRAPPSETEIAREIQNLRTAGRANVEGEPTRRSPQWAQHLVSAIDGNSVISSAAGTLALFEEMAPAMTPDAVEAAMRGLFTGKGPRMLLVTPAAVTGVEEALAAAEKAAPAVRQAERKVTMDDLPPLGPPGREVSRQRIEDMDATIVRFDNGSSLVFKKTDYEKGRVSVQLRFGGGMSALPPDRKTVAWMAPLVGSSGIAQLDIDALERLMTGRRMSLSFGMTEESFELGGGTTAEELPDQLRLLASKLAFPRWDSALFARYRASALGNYQMSFASASARAGREFGGVTRSGDARWAPLERNEIVRSTPRHFAELFGPLLAQGPIEAVIVGDVALEAAVKAMLGTVAALPPRPEPTIPEAWRKVRPPRPNPVPARFTHEGDPNQAFAAIGWSTLGGTDRIRDRRALAVAANMVQVRLFERLRDVEGATYSPNAVSATSETFPEWGVFYTAAEIRPERTDLFFRLAREIVADAAAKPASPAEFERAQNPIVSGIERRLRTNGYWAGAMEDWSRRPDAVEQVRSYLSDYRSMTAEEVRAALARYVTEEGDWSMLVLPGPRTPQPPPVMVVPVPAPKPPQ
jgi:zinc protease